MKLVFLGPPGAGKGTQASMVCQRFAIPHISTGDMLRAAIANGTETGMKAKVFMDRGQLVPDEVLIEMVRERLNEKDCEKGFLLDGFPRTVDQAEALEGIAAPDVVVDVDVADEKLLDRLTGRRVCEKCGESFHVAKIGDAKVCSHCGGTLIQRDDDKPETIKNRLDVYEKNTSPLVEYYRGQNILKVVDGDRDADVVYNEVKDVLGL